MYLFFIFPIGCVCCCLFFRCRVKSGLGFAKRVWVLYLNIRGVHVNFDELAVDGSDYDVFVCAKYLIAHISQSSISLSLVTPNIG